MESMDSQMAVQQDWQVHGIIVMHMLASKIVTVLWSTHMSARMNRQYGP